MSHIYICVSVVDSTIVEIQRSCFEFVFMFRHTCYYDYYTIDGVIQRKESRPWGTYNIDCRCNSNANDTMPCNYDFNDAKKPLASVLITLIFAFIAI